MFWQSPVLHGKKKKSVVVEVLLYVHRNHRLIGDGSTGRPPRLSHSSWALLEEVIVVAFYQPISLGMVINQKKKLIVGSQSEVRNTR